MCLIAIGFQLVAEAPLVIGANREEYYQRGGTPPQLIAERCRFIAGLDPVAGGTWLGINEHGVAIAVTNRRRSQMPEQPRSRGLLVRELLACTTARAAVERGAGELAANRYAGCNLLCADGEQAAVIHAADGLRIEPLRPGLHVLTAHDVDDLVGDPRIAYSLRFLEQARSADLDTLLATLKRLCSDRNGPSICLHENGRGTVSSSIIAWTNQPEQRVYWHAQGSPDETPYVDYSQLLRTMTAG
jgi:uncharacterized protein with NRDE domain